MVVCSCGKEITSKLTGEYCTSCYMRIKKEKQNVSISAGNSGSDGSITSLPARVGEINRSIGESNEVAGTADRQSEGNQESSRTDNPAEGQSFGTATPSNRGDVEGTKSPESGEVSITSRLSKSMEQRDPNKKYCQSCIERGYGLVEATREWTPNYFICDDCITPLINNITSIGDNEVKEIREHVLLDERQDILKKFYDALEYPEVLRFANPDLVQRNREKIFHASALANVNLTIEQLATIIAQYQVIAFQVRETLNAHTARINKLKEELREAKFRAGSGPENMKDGDGKVISIKSKTKLSQDEKMANVYFRHVKDPKERLKKYLEMEKLSDAKMREQKGK